MLIFPVQINIHIRSLHLTPRLKCVDRLCSQNVGVLASSLTKCRKACWGLEPKLKWMPDLCWRREIQMNRAGQGQTQRGDGYILFRSDRCNYYFLSFLFFCIEFKTITNPLCRLLSITLLASLSSPCFPHFSSLSRFFCVSLSCHCSLSEVIEGKGTKSFYIVFMTLF